MGKRKKSHLLLLAKKEEEGKNKVTLGIQKRQYTYGNKMRPRHSKSRDEIIHTSAPTLSMKAGRAPEIEQVGATTSIFGMIDFWIHTDGEGLFSP